MKNVKYAVFPLFLVLLEMAMYLSNDAYLPALPDIQHTFATTVMLTQLTITVMMLGNCSTQLFLGPLSDHVGRRPILLTGGFIFVLATLLCAIAPDINILLIARFIQGACLPALFIAGYATIHESFEQHEAIKKLTWMGSVTILAPAFGPMLGSILLYAMNWRGIFIVLFVFALCVWAALWHTMPETLTPEKRQPLHFMNALRQYGRILTNTTFLLRMLVLCGNFAALLTWVCAGPILVISTFGYSTIAFGEFAALIFGCFIIGMRFVNWKLSSIGPNKLIKYGLIFASIGSIWLVASALIMPSLLAPAIIGLMITGIGVGFVFPILNRFAVEASDEPMGARMAVFASLIGLFGVLGSLAATFVSGSLIGLALSVFGFILFSAIVYAVALKCKALLNQ
jgi:DHA1 family multidrug/chloramphenicol efflux transport protein-like MFS transporter